MFANTNVFDTSVFWHINVLETSMCWNANVLNINVCQHQCFKIQMLIASMLKHQCLLTTMCLNINAVSHQCVETSMLLTINVSQHRDVLRANVDKYQCFYPGHDTTKGLWRRRCQSDSRKLLEEMRRVLSTSQLPTLANDGSGIQEKHQFQQSLISRFEH